MALKRLKVKTVPASAKPGEIPEISIEGDLVRQYNKASDAAKQAEATMKELKPDVLEIGQGEVLTRSVADPIHPTFTVKLVDETGEALRVQFTKRYGQIADVDALEQLFEEADVDINQHVQEKVVGVFDSKVFLDDKGEFSRKKYDAYLKAVQAVAAKFGDSCPLSTDKQITPKDTWHDKRWSVFTSVESQAELVRLMPNTTQIVPVRAKNGDKLPAE